MKRIAELLNELKKKEVDGYFTSSVSNITYLTGFTGDSSRLFVSANRCVLMTDGRYTEQAAAECPPEIEIFKWIDNKRYATETYNHVMHNSNIARIGFEGNILTHAEFCTIKDSLPNAVLVTIDGTVEEQRQQKDVQEIENLRIACAISDKALELTLPYVKIGITELQLAAQLEYQLKTNGAENVSFDTLVISGLRSSLLHGKPSNKPLQIGDIILLDFGALYHGYHADISRTFVLGKANNQQKEVYSIIQKSQNEAIKSLRDEIPSQLIDLAVRNCIPEKYLDYYYPGLGHGVGLQIHEEPFLGKDYKYTIRKNMVITIEPGIYIPGWGGIRIEDTVVITDNGTETLTNFPRNLIEL